MVAPRFRVLLQKDPKLFGSVPKVFYEFDSERDETNRIVGPNLTGVWASLDRHRETLDLAFALHPDTRKVVVISGNGPSDTLKKETAQVQFRKYESRAEFSYLTGDTVEELRSELAALPKKSVVIFLNFNSDRAGNNYSGPEALSMIAPASSAPIYGYSDTLMGLGITGGKLLDFEGTGRSIGEMSLRVLAGERPEGIPQETAPTVMTVDWRELQRWGISEKNLPPGTVARFRQPSFWELYKWYAIGLVAAVIIEAMLIAWLLLLRARRRHAEAENLRLAHLAQAERKELNEVVSNVPGIVWEARLEPGANNRKTTFISDHLEKMLGYTADEWLSQPSGFGFSLIPDEEDRERVRRESKAVIATGKEGFSQYRWTAKDGRIIWAESYLAPICDENGMVTGLRGVTLDVSARKQGEEMLRRKQAELSGIIGSAMDAIITVDENQQISLFNAAAEMIFGCPATEAIGRPLEQFIPQRFRKAHRNHIRVFGEDEVTRRSMGAQTDLWGLRASGEEFPVEASISQIGVDGKNFYTVILRDVTQRKLAEEVLRQSEERFSKAFRANPQPMSLTTVADGRFLDVNDSFLTMSGYTRDEVIGHTSVELKVWENVKSRSDFVLQLAEQGSTVNIETAFRTKNGSSRVLLCSAESLEIGGEKCLLTAASDITERTEAEEALRAAHEEVSRLKNQLQEENIYLREEINLEHNFGEIVGRSDALKYVLFKIEQVAPTETTVLITGETGTGKELVARAIHNASARRDRPLVRVNCAALSPSLIESEFFGHEKGAFTGASARKIGRFELANGATIFLDEIGELPPELQVKLLRVIQEGELERLGSSRTIKIDSRIIAATNQKLEVEVKKGTFREDLWYRLNVFPITVPPLRQRREDIPLLVEHFVRRFSEKLGKVITSVSPATLKSLRDYSWPGNVRELANVVERAVINAHGPVLRIGEDFPEAGFEKPAQATKTLDELERDYIIRILNETNWRVEGQSGAARILGINPSTLRARMGKFGIHKPRHSFTS